jgi:hypothetical protein
LVLRMVKNVQLQKSKGQNEATTNGKSSSTSSWGTKNLNKTQSGERNVEIGDTIGRDQHIASSQQVWSN